MEIMNKLKYASFLVHKKITQRSLVDGTWPLHEQFTIGLKFDEIQFWGLDRQRSFYLTLLNDWSRGEK